MDLDVFRIAHSHWYAPIGTLGVRIGIVVTIPPFLGNGKRCIAMHLLTGEFPWIDCYYIDLPVLFPSNLVPLSGRAWVLEFLQQFSGMLFFIRYTQV